MRTLHLYLLRQVLATLMMTVCIFTFVLLLGSIMKDLMEVIMTGQVSFGMFIYLVTQMILWVLAFALPMGMLTAALLVCGRLSAGQELIAVRASGVSLVSLVTPILVLSVLMSALCAWINCEIAPASRVAVKDAINKAIAKQPMGVLQSGQHTTIRNTTVYVGKREGSQLENVMVYVDDEKGQLVRLLNALKATFVYTNSSTNQQLLLQLHDAYSSERTSQGWSPAISGFIVYPVALKDLERETSSEPPISDMTFRQLKKTYKQLDRLLNESPMPAKTDVKGLENRSALEEFRSEVRVTLHRQVAFSFACIGFTLIGIPLGIRAHRRETSIGIAIALLLVLIYYSFLILAQAWDGHPERHPHIIMWLPNFIFQIVGGVLLWKANRRG